MRENFIHGLVDELKSIQYKKRGFSLIELLVVFAVFSVLLSLLGPTLKKISEAAIDLNCINNQKQIGLGTHVYLADFNDQFFTAPDTLDERFLLDF